MNMLIPVNVIAAILLVLPAQMVPPAAVIAVQVQEHFLLPLVFVILELTIRMVHAQVNISQNKRL